LKELEGRALAMGGKRFDSPSAAAMVFGLRP
jgi:hypothetical protein